MSGSPRGADRLGVRFVLGVRQGGGPRVLREPDPAGTGRALREVPFVGRRQAQGPVAARHARDDPARWILGPGGRAGGRGGSSASTRPSPRPTDSPRCPRRRSCPPPWSPTSAAGSRWARRSPRRLGLRGEGPDIGDTRGPRLVVVAAAQPSGRAEDTRGDGRLVSHTDRPFHRGQARREGAASLGRSRPPDVDPAPLVRSRRPAADSSGGRRLHRRPIARRVRAAGRPPAR